MRGDALCDEGIAHAKGAALGQIAVEVDVAGGIVIASQQDTAALGGLQGLDHGGDGLLCVGGKGSRGGLEVDGARGLCGSGLLKGNELFVDGFCLGGGGCVLGCSGGSGFLIRGAGALAMACGARGNRRGGGGRGCDIICTIGAFQDPDDDGNEQDGDGGEHDPQAGACGGVVVEWVHDGSLLALPTLNSTNRLRGVRGLEQGKRQGEGGLVNRAGDGKRRPW